MKFRGNFHPFISPEKMIYSHHSWGKGVKQVTGVYTEARMVKQRQLGLYREIGDQIGVKFGYSCFPEKLKFCRE